jgi:hypothetical protein
MQQGQGHTRRRILLVSAAVLVLAAGLGFWKLRAGREPVVGQLGPRAAAREPPRLPPVITPSGEVTVAAEPERQVGTVTGRVVTSPGGAPIPGAEVSFDIGFGGGSSINAVQAGPDGNFRFETGESGPVRLASVRAAGFFPFAPELGKSRVVLQLRPGVHVKDVLIALEEMVAYKGKVVDRNDKPIAGARVAVVDLGNVEADLESLQLSYLSDAQGELAFQAPAGGILEAQHPSFLPRRVEVNVAVQASRSLTIRLEPRPPEGGPQAGLSGRVVGPQNEPVGGARVVAQDAIGSGAQFVTVADPTGAFQFAALPAPRCQLTGAALGYGATTISNLAAGAGEVLLRLHRGITVSGRVVDAEGKPVTAFSVIAETVVGPLARRRLSVTTSFDAEGRFLIEDIPPGPLALTAVAQVGAPSREQLLEVAQGTPPPEVVLALRRGRTVRGRVVEDGVQAAVKGARVTINGSPSEGGAGLAIQGAAVTGEDGRFELRGLSAGRASVTVWAEGFNGRVVSPVIIPEDEDSPPVEVTLGRVLPGQVAKLELSGIGAVLAPDGDALLVKKVIAGGGAAEAGLAPGDAIVTIDGRPVVEIGFAESTQLIMGPVGTPVRLGLRRPSSSALVDLTVVRRKIRV